MENPAFKNQTQLLTFATLNIIKLMENDIVKQNREINKRFKKNSKMLTAVLEDYVQISALLKNPYMIASASATSSSSKKSAGKKKILIKQKTEASSSDNELDESDDDPDDEEDNSSDSSSDSSSDEESAPRKRVSVNRDIADFLIDGQKVKNVYHNEERVGTYSAKKNMIMYGGKEFTLSSFVATHRKEFTQYKYCPVNAWRVCKCQTSDGRWIPILKNN